MRSSLAVLSTVLATLSLASLDAMAATIQTLGAGSAVSWIDRSTTFDDLDYLHNGSSLSDYTSNGLNVKVDGDSFAGNGPASWPYFNPFHITSTAPPPPPDGSYYYPGGGFSFPDGGSTGWVTIETADSKGIVAAEFLYGNGWTTGDIDGLRTGYPWGHDGAYVEWQTLTGGAVVSSGQIGPDPILGLGTVIGFYDPNGFDQLQVRCLDPNSSDPSLQALALDNLDVQLVPEPCTLALLGGALSLLGATRRRKRSQRV